MIRDFADKLIFPHILKKFPYFFCNLTVNHRVHIPPFAPNLSQMNPVGALTFSITKIHFTIILPYMRRSSRRSLPVRCTNKSHYINFTSPMRATCPAHTVLDFVTLIIFEEDKFVAIIFEEDQFVAIIFEEDQFVAIIFLHLLGLCKMSLLLFPPHKSARSPSSFYWLQELKYGDFKLRHPPL